MKTFTQLNEAMGASVTSDINPGNALGVMNHYTPIENILMNVRNLFCPILGCVVCIGEDNVSIKIHSTKFVNKEEIAKLLMQPVFNHLSLKDYVMQQGLDLIKMINVGQYWIVYFCPRDIPQANPVSNPLAGGCAPSAACHEQIEDEVEIHDFINEDSDDDEETTDANKKEFAKIIQEKDKVKAAKQFENTIAKSMELPRNYYFASVKDKESGKESIALRWKYEVNRPFGKTAERTRSLINIFGLGKDNVWVNDYNEKAMFQLPDDVKKLIDNILDLIGAEESSKKGIYEIPEDKKDDKKDDKQDDKKDDKGDDSLLSDTSDNSSKKKEDDDDKRGGSSDDLLG